MTLAKLRQPLTSSSVLPDARHVVVPDGIVATGFPAAEKTCSRIGITFDGWQRDLNRLILAKTADGLYAADTVVMSIPRQVGKTYDVGALVFADSIINPGTTTVWTAHRFKVARETFNELRGWAKSSLLAPHIDYDEITTAAGNESIPFRNGSRIVFAARERGAIRGFTKVRRLILDEGQILTEAAMADLAPTMNQAENPQIIIMGTPPKPSDPGEVFTNIRDSALGGDTEGLLYAEFAADVGAPVVVHDPGFWPQLAKANPSFPSRTGKRAITRLRKLLTDDDDFRREVYGTWDTHAAAAVFGPGRWEACAGDEVQGLELGSLALAADRDLGRFGVVGAALDGDGVVQAKPLFFGPGASDAVEFLVGMGERFGVPVGVDGRGPAAVLIPELEKRGVDVVTLKTTDVLDACSGVFTAVTEGLLRHGDYPELNAAVAGAKKRDVGDRWAWGRKGDDSVAQLEAATFAHWLLSRPAPEPVVSAYASRGVLTI